MLHEIIKGFTLALALIFGITTVMFAVVAADKLGYGVSNRLASAVFPISITPADLHDTYASREHEVKILIVPGHDNQYSGAAYRRINESDLNLLLSKELFNYIKDDDRFSVYTTRDFETGEYTYELANYFNTERAVINAFRDSLRSSMRYFVAHGTVKRNTPIERNEVNSEIAYRLYGINKWANDNKIDIVLHVHFNDYPGRVSGSPGRYNGFSIYTPENQYGNSIASVDVARALYDQLNDYFAPSDLPLEQGGFLQDQDLIAIGANASRLGVSILIEYGYIYEPQFASSSTREPITKELAFHTYKGLDNYFKNSWQFKLEVFETTLLPFKWSDTLRKGIRGSREVLSLQAALKKDGYYPPPERTQASCPINGNFGPCTERAVKLFQEAFYDEILFPNNLASGTGIVGPTTRNKLNSIYGN
jgi:N-acetylmuramoyl-L-alanine amidase